MLGAAGFIIPEAFNKFGANCGPEAVWFKVSLHFSRSLLLYVVYLLMVLLMSCFCRLELYFLMETH